MDLSSLGAKGTLVIIMVIIAMSLWAWYDSEFEAEMVFDISAIKGRMHIHRLLTSGFIHADFFHLLFNVISFHSFAQDIETNLGLRALILIFIGGILLGNLLSLAWNFRQREYIALGASGGVTSVIFANILLDPGESSIFMFMLPMPVPSSVYAVAYILISYYALKRAKDNIGHDAHLGGAAFGIIAAIFVDFQTVRNHPIVLLFLALPLLGILIYELKLIRKIKNVLSKP